MLADRLALARSERGSIFALSLVLLYIIVVLGLCFFSICMFCGGNREFRDAVEAGSLSMIKSAMLEPTIKLSRREDPDELFEPVLEPYDGVTLKNLNRLSAVALLVEVNETAMESEGTANFRARQHAAEINDKVGDLALRFSRNVLDRASRMDAFRRLSATNGAQMLGMSIVRPERAVRWQTSFLNPGTASNIALDDKQIPQGINPRIPMASIEIGGIRRNYIAGYRPINTGASSIVRSSNRTFFFPLRPPLQPHLVSQREFDKEKRPPRILEERFCVPNAFSAHGLVRINNGDQVLEDSGYAVAEAMDKGYGAAIPGGFIRIENKTRETVEVKEWFGRLSSIELRRRVLQRLWQIDPEFKASDLDRLMDITLEANRKALVSPSQRRLPLSARNAEGDGQDALRPYSGVRDFELHFIPSTGFNNLLAVLEIHENELGPGLSPVSGGQM